MLEERALTPRGAAFRCVLFLILSLLNVSSGSSDAWADAASSTADKVAAFEDSVLVRNGDRSDWYATKWTNPIRVGILTEGLRPQMLQKVSQLLSEAESLTGTKIRVGSEEANFIILLSKNVNKEIDVYRPQLRRFFRSEELFASFFDEFAADGSHCARKIAVSTDWSMSGYFMIVGLDDNSGIFTPSSIGCLVNGLVVGLGVIGVTPTGVWGIPLGEDNNDFTDKQKEMLRALYDHGVVAGTKHDQVLERVKQIFDQGTRSQGR